MEIKQQTNWVMPKNEEILNENKSYAFNSMYRSYIPTFTHTKKKLAV